MRSTSLTERGLPAWQVGALLELQEAILAGRAPHLAQVTADVQTATGRPPRSFAQFAQREFRAVPGCEAERCAAR
jgi:hypothetical protein